MNIFDIPPDAVIVADQIFVALHQEERSRSSSRRIFHAVTPYRRRALCSAEPAAGSAWAEPPGKEITCPSCLKRLQSLETRFRTALRNGEYPLQRETHVEPGTSRHARNLHPPAAIREIDDLNHWVKRAEEARMVAEQLADAIAKRTMSEIAAGYEVMAELSKTHGAGCRAGPDAS